MKFLFLGIVMTGFVTSIFLYKCKSRKNDTTGKWDKVYNPKEINT